MTRDEKIREARRLRALGWTAPAIGRELGVPESTIRNWYLGGDCEKCGAPIERSSAKRAAKSCEPCSHEVTSLHGTRSMYNRGCRCDDCKRSLRDYMQTLKGRPAPSHSLSGYGNYGCRCDICRAANSEYERRRRERRKQAA